MAKDPRSPRDLVLELRAAGLSSRDIAAELERHPRMVSKILRGETSGENYRRTLTELVTTGTARSRPARRRRSDGSLVPVRSTAVAGQKSAPPPDTEGRYVGQPARGRFSTTTTYMQDGGRIHEITMPKTKNAKGRVAGTEEILRRARSAAKGQRWAKKNIKFEVTFANGRVMEVGAKGGYSVSTFLSKANEFGGDAVSWLLSQTTGRYTNLDVNSVPITGLQMNIYSTTARPAA